ncbi:alginate export family protein [Nitrosomonas sp. H1_AOB3]|uniref:alginate export family protein n=1 Tax=Nitrosomonas sp. H1_AOB3 TaxID=2741553 RepID=UPI0019369AC6|nr:alginate export family protein [Nitrosomonas sp. H1_AOB3]QOJ10207.1 MAG: alginate export family protein [Nitrosomonas sp. H1_AOB3]
MLLNRVIFQKQSDRLLFGASLPNTVLRILFFYCFPAVCLFVSSIAATRAGQPPGQINQYLRINGEFLGSYENWNYFRPASAVNNSYDLWVVRSRLGLMFSSDYADGLVQGQYSGLYGLPDDAALPSGGALGLGAGYFLANRTTGASNVFLKQGYLNFKFNKLGLPGVAVKIGRFELADGMEYRSGVEKFDALKKKRIAERLVGGFNAIYVGRAFDGFSVVYDGPGFNATVSGVHPVQGNLTVQGQKQISDISILYAALTSKKDAVLPGIEGRLYYLNYDDQRVSQVTDNRPLSARPQLSDEKLNIHTIGVHLLSLQPLGSGSFDALLMGAYQFGSWTNLSHRAWAFDAEVGYQWHKLPFKPWVRAVYYRSSGDGNAHDGRHQTFFSAVPSGRLYAKFPFYNQMNIQDIFFEFIAFPTGKTQINVNLHQLSLANVNDLLYTGLGASLKSGAFGYSGSTTHGHREIGQLIDVTLTHGFNKYLTSQLYFAHAFGGSAMKSIYPSKSDASIFLVNFNLVF